MALPGCDEGTRQGLAPGAPEGWEVFSRTSGKAGLVLQELGSH